MSEEQVGMSPVPVEKLEEVDVKIDFHQAIDAVLDGKRVGRFSWPEGECMFMSPDEFLMIHKDGKDHLFTLRKIDMAGVDFFVIK